MMPVYNGEKTLKKAIASLISQSYTHWNCIIVNDGSTDETFTILSKVTDERFKIIHFPHNLGRPSARQEALNHAKGDFLAFLDADDFYHPKKIELQVAVFLQYPEVDLVSCFMGSFDDSDELKNVRGVSERKVEKQISYAFTGSFEAPHAASMTRLKSALETGYNMAMKYGQDSDFFIRYLVGKKYFVVNQVLYYYSEFDSVTKSKILKTYYYNIIKLIPFVSKFPLPALKSIAMNVSKFTYTLILSVFVEKSYFVSRRGRKAHINEVENFIEVCQNLKDKP